VAVAPVLVASEDELVVLLALNTGVLLLVVDTELAPTVLARGVGAAVWLPGVT
jgi:hypothetical protein